MITMTAFDAYKTYQAIRLHFNSGSYDYFRYRTIKASKDKFDTRNDKYFYHKLSKHEDVELFLASVFLKEDSVWIGNLFDEKYSDIYRDTQRRLQSLEYNFKSEIESYDSLDEALTIVNGDWPKIIYDYKRGAISPETMVILDSLTQCMGYWTHEEQHLNDKVILPTLVNSLKNYKPFVNFDRERFKKVLMGIF